MRSSLNSGRMSCDRLCALGKRDAPRVIRQLAKSTARKFSPTPNTPGSLQEGGGGAGRKADAITCISYARYGPTQHFEYEVDPVSASLRAELRVAPTTSTPHSVPASEVLIQYKTEKELSYRAEKGMAPERPGLLKKNYVRNQIHRRRAKAKALVANHDGVLSAMRAVLSSPDHYVRSSPRVLRDVIHHLRRRNFGKCLRVLRNSWNVGLSLETANKLLQTYSPEHFQRVTHDLLPALRGWESKTQL